MKCYNDPTRDAVGICVKCGKGVCPEEVVMIDGKLYCKECSDRMREQEAREKEDGKRLYRSRKDRVLFGVCGGIAKYFNVDPTIVRIIWVILTFAYGVGIILYIIMALIIPKEPFED
jgi:phage shock protein C